MTMIAVETRKVGLEEVDERYSFLRLCDQKKLLRLRESVKGEGVRNPIVVSDGIEEGKLVVVDGFKRLRVAKESGFKEIEVRVMTVNAASLHAALLACNRPEKGVSDLEEGWVVQSLHRRHQMSQVSIGKLLSRHKSWVCRRLKMVEHLEDGIQEEIRLGLLTVSMARELCRLPRGNQIEVARSIHHGGAHLNQLLLLQNQWSLDDIVAAIRHAGDYAAYDANAVLRILNARFQQRRLDDRLGDATKTQVQKMMAQHPVVQRSLNQYETLKNGDTVSSTTEEHNEPQEHQ